MKKIILFITVAFITLFISCDKQKEASGLVGRKISITIPVSSKSDTAGKYFRWEFESKPDNSALNITDFQPSNSSYSVSFIPEVPGKYNITGRIIDQEGSIEKEKSFLFNIIEDTTQKSAGISSEREDSLIQPDYGQEEDTTIEEEEMSQKEEPERQDTITSTEQVEFSLPSVSGKKFTIQVSSWGTNKKAREIAKKLEKYEIQNIYIQKFKPENNDTTWYRVRAGVFDSVESAKKKVKNLSRRLFMYNFGDFWIDNFQHK